MKKPRKSISLVGVFALCGGLLAITSVPSASAANNAAVGAANTGTAATVMNVATSLADPAVGNTVTVADLKSLGLMRVSTATNTTGTAVLRSNGKITVYLTGAADGASTIVIENGTTANGSSAVTAGAKKVLNAGGTRIAMVDDAAATVLAATITPDANVTSMTISYYQEAGVTANNGVDAEETAAATAATTDALTAIGTLTAKYVVAVVPVSSFLSVSGTFCLITDSSGNVTTDDYNVVYATVPLGSTFSVTSVTSNDLVEVGTPGLITAATDTLAGNGLSATLATENSSSASIKPSAVGSFTVRLSANGAQQTATDAIYVTVVASCASSTWSPDKSFIENQVTGAVSQADDNVDDTPFWADGTVARVALRIKSAYDSDVPAGTWVVSATNGAKVGINSGGAGTGATCGSTTAASVYGTGADIKIAVCQGTDYTAQVTTVTVSYGATTILTRTILITGDVAKLTISSVEQGRTGTQTFRVFKASAYDAAGNRVSVNPSADVTTLDQNVTAADIGTTSVSADVQNANFITCGAGAKGSTNVKFKVTANSGATVTSDAIKFSCGDSLRTYTASLDKATYVPGDIATLTITYKDINGGVPYDSYNAATGNATDDVVQYVNGSNVAPAISGSQMTAIAAPAAGDIVAGGVKTYQFVVGSTEGSYQMAVNLTGITTDAAKAVSYSVKSSTTSVTNAEVLAAIVKLIASINKQIRALQKSLRR